MTKYNILRSHKELTTDEWWSVVEFYKSHTAKETAAFFGLEFKQALISALAREVPKTGHGGARSGSGNLSPDKQKAKEVANAILEAKAIAQFSTLDPDSVNESNWQDKRVETRNKINNAIAALKAIAATLGIAAAIYVLS